MTVEEMAAILAALVHRSGGNVKLRTSDFNKADGKKLTIEAGNGYVRVKTGAPK